MSLSVQNLTRRPFTMPAIGGGIALRLTQRCRVLRSTARTSAASDTEYFFMFIVPHLRHLSSKKRTRMEARLNAPIRTA